MPYLTVSPAMGRDYKSKKEAVADWESGKDFVNESGAGGRYVSVREVPKGTTVNIRYKALREIAVVPPKR